MKPLRSLLYSPGNRPKTIAKAPEAGADAVVFDLADSVPLAEKNTARRLVAEAIPSLRGRELFVKLNDAGSEQMLEDVDAVVLKGLSGVILPKVSDPSAICQLDRIMSLHERARGLQAGAIEVIVLLETPGAVLRVFDLVTASARVASVCCGTAEGADLMRSLGCGWSLDGPERTYLRGRVILAARAAGVLWPLDGVFANLSDPEGLETEANLAHRLGFRGKLVIHPKQVEPVNRIFTPSPAEVHWSQQVLAAYGESLARGASFTVLDGRLIGTAAAARAKSVLALAAQFAG